MKRLTPVFALGSLVPVGIMLVINGASAIENIPLILSVSLAVVFGAVFGFVFFKRLLKQQERMVESYVLTFEGKLVTREQDNTPSIAIYESDITSITKTKHGGYVIRGREKRDLIVVPYFMDDPDLLEQELTRIAPIGVYKHANDIRQTAIVTGLMVVSMVGVYLGNDLIIVGPAGITLLLIMGWVVYAMRKHRRNIDEHTRKRLRAVYFLIPLFAFMVFIKVVRAVPYLLEKFPFAANTAQTR